MGLKEYFENTKGVGVLAIAGDDRQGSIFHKVGSGVNRRIDFTVAISRGQYAHTFCALKIFIKFHHNLLWREKIDIFNQYDF